jgi:GR25 family glycosyltransferase involved in LPS biosynthesis
MTQYLQHIVYINLEEREDRRQHFCAEFAKLGTGIPPPVRIPAIKTQQGAIGCTMSHIKAIEYAKRANWAHVFICEDDITFTNPQAFIHALVQSQQEPETQEWDVLLVVGNNWFPYRPLTEHCLQVHSCLSAAGYIVRQHYYDHLLQNFKNGLDMFQSHPDKKHMYALDVYWRQLQIRDRWLMLIPATVNQWEKNYSDIEQRPVKYSNLLLNPYKK